MLENQFKTETVGLVTRAEFVEKQRTLADRIHAEAKRQREVNEESAYQKKEQDRAKKAKAEQRHKLSFDDELGVDEEEEDEEQQEQQPTMGSHAAKQSDQALQPRDATASKEDADAGPQPRRRFATLGKDPTVRSDFLPDKDRERAEAELRETLKAEWALQQAAIKAEPLEITYSYWNGSGHRRVLTVCKGDTIAAFLKAVQEQLAPTFREIRLTNVGNLMYVKEDIVLPHTVSFYDLIVNRAMGKSGPLFQFDLQEHAATVFDPRVKSQDSHAGKVVERHWYNRNRHIFPYSRWEVYDPDAPAGGAKEGEGQRDIK
jgi:protein FAM50